MDKRLVLGLFLSLCAALVARAEPPRVVSATPDNGQTDVDPATRQITIVFDQPMNHDAWSIVGGGPTFPKVLGKPKWTDDRTIVLAVKLEADHDYWLSINSDRFTNFRNRQGEAAVPYPIAFSTAAAKGAAIVSPQTNRKAIEELRRAIDQDYSYRELHKLDWDNLFVEYGPRLEQARSPAAFARHAAAMLAANKDMHVLVKVGERTYPTHRPHAAVNFNPATLSPLVPQFKQHNNVVATGRFDDGIHYILIATWGMRDTGALEPAFAALADARDAKGLILDVRPNSGGDESLAQQFAGCFIDQPRTYSKNTIRKDGEWLGPFDRIVQPNKARPSYRGPVVVLMGPQNMSSCESFLLMMRQVGGCKLVGARSYGSSGNPKPVELSNGVTVLLPSWQDMLPDGSLLEGIGVLPDVEVKTDAETLKRTDAVLAEALKILRGNR
jgi:hypothetical protein